MSIESLRYKKSDRLLIDISITDSYIRQINKWEERDRKRANANKYV